MSNRVTIEIVNRLWSHLGSHLCSIDVTQAAGVRYMPVRTKLFKSPKEKISGIYLFHVLLFICLLWSLNSLTGNTYYILQLSVLFISIVGFMIPCVWNKPYINHKGALKSKLKWIQYNGIKSIYIQKWTPLVYVSFASRALFRIISTNIKILFF